MTIRSLVKLSGLVKYVAIMATGCLIATKIAILVEKRLLAKYGKYGTLPINNYMNVWSLSMLYLFLYGAFSNTSALPSVK